MSAPDRFCENSPESKRVVAVDHDDLFSFEIQVRERPQPAQAHRTCPDPFLAEQVDGDLGLFSERAHGDNDHISVVAPVVFREPVLPAKALCEVLLSRLNYLHGIPHRTLDIPAEFKMLVRTGESAISRRILRINSMGKVTLAV